MVFAKPLRERIRGGRIRCSVRIWTRPHVKAGGRYRMADGHIVVLIRFHYLPPCAWDVARNRV